MIAYVVSANFGNTLYFTKLSHIYLYVCIGAITGLYDRCGTSHDACAGSKYNQR
jgi:hypothetical protein